MGLEQQFAQLEASSGVDNELAAMKAQLSGSYVNLDDLPANAPQDSATDAELKKLRAQLNNT
ncbi:conserved hypothetical protein [Hyella patelloides LEGE 07179]|uniref:Uncharacterized protein n=1 Tax=Hyella patelloides LEGE 07179 TaxID=945734 RepID=A0A563VQI8_9CYAN|nr:hypothetical protein [Hyella patelloides]VEP13693.1 conserved hypothetical protein [Hyella patelloides LEGE 07179]